MTGTSTLGMTRADWLAARRTGIGGSDAAKRQKTAGVPAKQVIMIQKGVRV